MQRKNGRRPLAAAPNLLGVLENTKLPPDLPLIARHWTHPPSPSRRLKNVSREYLHIYT